VADHKQAKKRIRQNEKRRKHNQHLRSRMRTMVRQAQVALEGDDATAAAESVRNAEREIRKASSKGIIPKNRASRVVSRLTKRLKAS
jgi:small subunit ribosomal protein S20